MRSVTRLGWRAIAASAVLLPALGVSWLSHSTDDGLPDYCAASGDDSFWQTIEESCVSADDSVDGQQTALRGILDDRSDAELADFQRAFVRANHRLDSKTLYDMTAEICGITLGEDLFTDYRSWIISHGQAAYDAVLADPRSVTRWPDAAGGCGEGEVFGGLAMRMYVERTGRHDLPVVEDLQTVSE